MFAGLIFYIATCLFSDGSELQASYAVTEEGPCLLSAPVAMCPPSGPCEARDAKFATFIATPRCAQLWLKDDMRPTRPDDTPRTRP